MLQFVPPTVVESPIFVVTAVDWRTQVYYPWAVYAAMSPASRAWSAAVKVVGMVYVACMAVGLRVDHAVPSTVVASVSYTVVNVDCKTPALTRLVSACAIIRASTVALSCVLIAAY